MSHIHFTLRAFRIDEWSKLRDLRLRALKENGGLFLRSYDSEAAYAEDRWKSLIDLENGRVFGLFADGNLIGITGVFSNEHDTSRKSVKLGMSYIDPAWRGLGLSRALYDARLAWARKNGFERAVVSHKDGNEASRRANAAFGFKWFASEEISYGDGSRALDHRYELNLGAGGG